MTRPESGIGSTKNEPKDSNSIYAGLWSNSKSVSTTQIFKVEDSVQTWSLEGGMSSRSLEGSLYFQSEKQLWDQNLDSSESKVTSRAQTP